MQDELTVSLQGVKKSFGRTNAVCGLDLCIRAGEFVGLVGPNGAGKSTTIRMLTGQLIPDAGRIEVCGVDVTADPVAARSLTGFVPEDPALYGYLTAREMVNFVATVRGSGDVEGALALAGLGGDADRQIGEYSQGMRRRTALACALVSHPKLLVLDESLNGLDPPSAERVVRALKKECAAGATVILSTHVLDTLERVADRVVMLEAGRVVADVQAADLDSVRGRFYTAEDGA